VPQDKEAQKKERKIKGVGGGGQYQQDRRLNKMRWHGEKGIKRKRENLIEKHKYEKQEEKEAKRRSKKSWQWSADNDEDEDDEDEENGDDSNDDAENRSAAAYASLLGALAPNMKKYNALLQRRRLEEQGEAEDEEEEGDDEDMEEEDLDEEGFDEDGEEDLEGSGGAASEDEDEELMRQAKQNVQDEEAKVETAKVETEPELLLDAADDRVDERSADPFKVECLSCERETERERERKRKRERGGKRERAGRGGGRPRKHSPTSADLAHSSLLLPLL
jgi:hypothetical protein